MDAVFGVGQEGGAIAREFSYELRRYAARQPGRRQQSLNRADVAQAWQQLFNAYPKLGFAPSVIKHRL